MNFKSKPWVWQLTNCSRGIPNAWRFNTKFGKSVYGAEVLVGWLALLTP
ncbi:DUF3265 domain-containing protein [Vibrio parahaemolyticus]|nr:DUF3265 domain-containing protein [Vibrio parahaemolyticus]EGQ9532259.1 DUF3265 domain-containing protein [Vibrio parahaemolyticus]EGQ9551982.1 DUF3265 domain-containing protein [Vibrio parahaemolyticus]EGQ9566415.1 DUF3265 domain-containing protein [Vibrio parahaemolyticus]EGR2998632.1 DUF3265 domain-containing protein [Vibrio parahaemolyticus]